MRNTKPGLLAVMQLSHFVDAAHLEEGLGLLGQVRHPGYYAKMAVAWALSVWFVKFPQETESLLAQRAFEPLGPEQGHPESAGIPPGEQRGQGPVALLQTLTLLIRRPVPLFGYTSPYLSNKKALPHVGRAFFTGGRLSGKGAPTGWCSPKKKHRRRGSPNR